MPVRLKIEEREIYSKFLIVEGGEFGPLSDVEALVYSDEGWAAIVQYRDNYDHFVIVNGERIGPFYTVDVETFFYDGKNIAFIYGVGVGKGKVISVNMREFGPYDNVKYFYTDGRDWIAVVMNREVFRILYNGEPLRSTRSWPAYPTRKDAKGDDGFIVAWAEGKSLFVHEGNGRLRVFKYEDEVHTRSIHPLPGGGWKLRGEIGGKFYIFVDGSPVGPLREEDTDEGSRPVLGNWDVEIGRDYIKIGNRTVPVGERVWLNHDSDIWIAVVRMKKGEYRAFSVSGEAGPFGEFMGTGSGWGRVIAVFKSIDEGYVVVEDGRSLTVYGPFKGIKRTYRDGIVSGRGGWYVVFKTRGNNYIVVSDRKPYTTFSALKKAIEHARRRSL